MAKKISAATMVIQLMQRARDCKSSSNSSCGPLCVSRLAYQSILFSKALDGLYRFSGSDCRELERGEIANIDFLDGSSVKVLVNSKGEVEDVIPEKEEATKEVTKCDEKGSLFLYYYHDCIRLLRNNEECRGKKEKEFFRRNRTD